MKLWRFWGRVLPPTPVEAAGEAASAVPGGVVGELSRLLGLAPAPAHSRSARNALQGLPRPALRWVGPAGRIALREFHLESDADAVCAFQEDTYSLNFPDFHFTRGFAQAFRHDLLRATLDNHHGLF